jgi:ribonuclease VapC
VIVDSSAIVALLGIEDEAAELAAAIEPVTAAQAQLARLAQRTFGRGSGHPAGPDSGVLVAS